MVWKNDPYTTATIGLIVILVVILATLPRGQVSHGEVMENAEHSFARLLQTELSVIIESELISEKFVVVREWSGGASCCLIIHVFQTKPELRKILEHNNDFFDATELVHAQDKLELHKTTWWTTMMSGPSHADLRYNPHIFDLRTGEWE